HYQLGNDLLISLINVFSDTSFSEPKYNGVKLNLKSKDILGHVYEYFLGQFALAFFNDTATTEIYTLSTTFPRCGTRTS
ncbi:SAM-dependent methyltransferase, partial [Escherichia coli]|nr:SAM-dependent methyltransferase [Escherichia coli]